MASNELIDNTYYNMLKKKVVIKSILTQHPAIFADIKAFLTILEGVMLDRPDFEIVNKLIEQKEIQNEKGN